MSDVHVYPIFPNFGNAHITPEKYTEMYRRSIDDGDAFWAEMADKQLTWFKKWTTVSDCDFTKPRIKWFTGGELNAAYNCVERHLKTRGEQTAIIWEPDDPTKKAKHITYNQLHEQVNRFANVLKKMGVEKGDRVCLYLPMIPEAAYAMLACARIGAIHSVVFAGFSAEALKNRIEDADAALVITADEGLRGGKAIPLKQTVDNALDLLGENDVDTLVVRHTGGDVAWHNERDHWYHSLADQVDTNCPAEAMEANDPLFILYTSGSTGKPKGVVHGTGGYLLYASLTHKYTFDYQEGEIFWCTADVGWITGHSYILYGPLCNGATVLMFEGVPNYPDYSRFWQIVDKHKVNIFYTAPTAIRALEAQGRKWVDGASLKSLRVLGTVGEPINPEAWEWYYRAVGHENCPIADTWWQTETGGHMITPLPGAHKLKPGSATRPFFGVETKLVDEEGKDVPLPGEGMLCITRSWPGQMQTVFRDHDRFKQAYFSTFPGLYFSGDGCRIDADGDHWITGRVDDILNVSGHRLGTAEIESALVLHPSVSEAAVVGYPHDIKGQGIYAYVTLSSGAETTDTLKAELVEFVRKEIGPIATLDAIQWAPSLPKTRSGKIMRRILRKIACNETDSLGDTSTLADPTVVTNLLAHREKV